MQREYNEKMHYLVTTIMTISFMLTFSCSQAIDLEDGVVEKLSLFLDLLTGYRVSLVFYDERNFSKDLY